MVFKRLPELLAPAGSPDALKAAVAAGADAVYISGKRFGARKFAANFDEKELKEAIDYAHLKGVRVYVTVNTLIREDELHDIALYLLWLYEAGADAVLVQDLGVVALAGQVVPDLELHASTQMTIHNSEGMKWAALQGIKRVVLSREVSLDDIEDMAEGAKVGIEVFVHGALCYCYSGQCLLSAAIGGRSGNRGMCAQPCRKPYVLLRGEKDEYGRPLNLQAAPIKEKFLISARDLSVYRHLDRIVRSPVESIKIEGRMKSPEYVAIVTSIYRRALDQIAKGGWRPSEEDVRELALAFNRDFTEGHILGAKDVMGREMSDNRGVLIGTVTSYDSAREEAAVKPTGPMTPEQGDGLVILSPGQEVGMVVYRPLLKDGVLKLRTPERVRPGAKVYMTSSNALSRKAQNIISSAKAQIPLDLQVSFEDETPVVEGAIEGGKRIVVEAGFRMEKAKSRPLTAEQIEAQLRRTGGTPFTIRRLEMDYPGGLFAPIGALNQLRRDLLARAEKTIALAHAPAAEKIAEAHERLRSIASSLEASAPSKSTAFSLAVYADSLETVRGAAEGGCRRIYFEPEVRPMKEGGQRMLDRLYEAKALSGDAELIWKWPRITRDPFFSFVRPLVSALAARGEDESGSLTIDGIMVEGMGAAGAVLAAWPGARLFGASGLNIWNHLSVRQLEGFRRLTLSPELSADQLALLISRARFRKAPEMELIVQGSLEVMTAEDCIPCLAKGKAEFWGLQDFRRIFPVRLDGDGRTHIFNSVETCLLDFMPRLFEIGLYGVAVDARGRTEKYAQEMAEIYLKAIEITAKDASSLKDDLAALKEEARRRSLGGITTGHFLKGLKEDLS